MEKNYVSYLCLKSSEFPVSVFNKIFRGWISRVSQG